MATVKDLDKRPLVQVADLTGTGTIPPPIVGVTYPPSPHAPTHISSADFIPLPTASTPGLMPPLNGNAATFYNGAGGLSQPYGSGPPLNVKGTVANHGALPTTGQQVNDIWVALDTGHGWVWNGTAWTDIGPMQGPTGPAGATGPAGPAGAPGSAGPTGTQGQPGPVGSAATIAVGSTATGPPGSQAAVTNSGSSQSAVFNFSIPQGVTGPNGPAGATGPAGAQGAAGPIGSQGPTGPQGATGPQGPPGGASAYTTLAASFTMPAANATAVATVASGGATQFSTGGVVYISTLGYLSITAINTSANTLTLQNLGYSVNAAQGTVATSGTTLTGTGPAGPQGPTGPAGPQGTQGVQGTQGATGSAGPQGPAGATGSQGGVGPAGPTGQGYVWRSAWNSAVAYAPYDSISYQGSSYVCIVANTNQPPPNATYWNVMSQQGSAGAQGPTGTQGNPGATGPTGATGPQGPGGPTGPTGTNAFTTITASFTVPPIGSSVTVTLANASWLVVGENLWVDQAAGGVGQGGIMQVTAVAGSQVTLLNISAGSGIPLADTTQSGLLAKVSGKTTDYIGGDNASHPLPEQSVPFVIGATAAIAQVPSGIIVPSYANHPDGIWTYGTYDDHFDGSTLNAKWSTFIGSGNAIVVSGSMVHIHSQASGANCYLYQAVPAGVNFTITFKVRISGFTAAAANATNQSSWLLSGNNVPDTTTSSAQIMRATSYSSTFGAGYNVSRLLIYFGANRAGYADGLLHGEMAPYWKFVYTTDGACNILFSFDGITYFNIASLSGAQTGFTTAPPAYFHFFANNGNGNNLISVDWFKLTTP